MKIKVIVTLKKGVLDPQGKAIQQTLDGMGFSNVNEVRQGKYFEIDVKENDPKIKACLNVLQEFSKGFYLNGRVLIPAKVVISKKPTDSEKELP